MSDCRLSPNKMQFLTEQDAKDYLKEMQGGSKLKQVRLHPYLCPNCRRWHYTSMKRTRQRKLTMFTG